MAGTDDDGGNVVLFPCCGGMAGTKGGGKTLHTTMIEQKTDYLNGAYDQHPSDEGEDVSTGDEMLDSGNNSPPSTASTITTPHPRLRGSVKSRKRRRVSIPDYLDAKHLPSWIIHPPKEVLTPARVDEVSYRSGRSNCCSGGDYCGGGGGGGGVSSFITTTTVLSDSGSSDRN